AHDQVEVTRRGAFAPGAALAGETDALAVGDARGDGDLEPPVSARAGERDRPTAATVCLVDGEHELGFLVGAGDRPEPPSAAATEEAAEAAEAAEEVVEVDVVAAGRVPDPL